MKLEEIQKTAQRMVEADHDRDKYFLSYQNKFHLEYELPSALLEIPYIHKVVSTDPYDAVSAGTKTFSGLVPKVKVMPMANDAANRKRANMIERVLKWQLTSSDRRRSRGLVADFMESALLYNTVAAQVIDLDWQIKQIEGMKGNARRWKAARRYSRFLVIPYNPRHVHVRYSNFMPEAVLVCQRRTAQAIADEFGVKGLEKTIEASGTLTYYEYWDYDTRAIWTEGEKEITIQAPGPHELPFLPWVANMGGSGMEEEAQHAYKGLLYSITQTGQWETQNTVETLRVSLAIKDAGKPPLAEEGTNTDSATIDAMSPVGAVKVPVGNTLRSLPPNQIDPALSVIAAALSGANSKTMVSNVLQGGADSGMAFASLNLMTQTAVGQLKPWTGLTEKALEEVFIQMLQWVHFTKIPLVGYGNSRRTMGDTYTIEPDEIDPESMYLKVELAPDLPTDRQQRGNTAIMLNQAGLYSQESGMEDIGIDDPEDEQEKIAFEKLKENELQLVIQRKQAEMQMEIMQMQQQIQQQAQQPPPPDPNAEAAQQEQNMMAAQQQEMMNGGGMMTDGNMGGQPNQNFQPGMTREQITGQDRAGNELAGMGL